MSSGPAPADRSARELTQEQALSMVRRYSHVQWWPTIASSTLAGLALVLVRRWLFEDSWSTAASYGAVIGFALMAVYLVLDWRRAHRMPDTTGWTRLERAEVMGREGPMVTVRSTSSRRRVAALVRQSHLLREGETVWVGPAVTVGEVLVLVRASAGPFGTPVLAAFEPATAAAV